METLSLFCIVPDYWRLAAITFFGAGSGIMPAVFYIGPLQSQVWGDKASEYASWGNAAQFFFAIFGAPLFGKWSDGRPRKTSVIVLSVAGMLRVIPYLIWTGHGKEDQAYLDELNIALVVGAVITALTGPFCSQLSGSPVMWAWMGDKIPPEHRETGFSLINSCGALAVCLTGFGASAVVTAMGLDPIAYIWGGVFLGMIAFALVLSAPSEPLRSDVELKDEEPHKNVCTDLLSPLKLILRKRSLRLICGVAAFVTLPDVAGTYIASTIVFVLMGVSGPTCALEQGELALFFSMSPNLVLIPVYIMVGVFAKRFGPAPFLAIFTPLACLGFAAPSLLTINSHEGDCTTPPEFLSSGTGHALEVFCGVMMCLPLAIYPPLSALVTQMVPSHRMGEAMGAIAACKNLASLIAPLLMAVILSVLEPSGYVYIFPGGAALMLVGAWPFSYLLAKRVTQDVDFQWSTWSTVVGARASASLGGSVQPES